MLKQYIINFKKKIINPESLLSTLSPLYKFKTIQVFKDIFYGAVIEIDDINLTHLKNCEFIDSIEEDFDIKISEITNTLTTLSLSNISKPLWYQTVSNISLNSTDYSKIHCYIIDTGISSTHTEFNTKQVSLDYCSIKGIKSATDDNFHGTIIASIIGGKNIGMANNISLHAIKVLDSNGFGKISSVIDGLNWVLKNKKPNAIINISLETPYSARLNGAVTSCINAGIYVCCSAGNGNTNISSVSPASTPRIYSIGAFDSTYKKTPFSNFGSNLVSFMPGVGIFGAYKSPTNTDYCNIDGTSFSSPMAAALVAMLLFNNIGISVLKMKTLLDTKKIKNRLSNVPKGTPNIFLKN